jgi:aspartyl-tRNA(Asn)/glutamyl-tRNA(Gln) amidotransferase subunit A
VSVVAAIETALARAEELQPTLGAFATLTPELALELARGADAAAEPGPLQGVPLAVKDIIDVAGVPTRLGSLGAGHHVPQRSAPVVEALVNAGAIVIGKTTTHELAFGMITPGARNPHDPGRIAGGSSGGSAVAVGAGIAPLALGTDTNGSIRAPAALCGVLGLKPTRGALPLEGIAPLAWTQDTVGLIAASTDVARRAWQAAGGGVREVDAVRVGVDRAAIEAASPAVREVVDAAIEGIDVEGPDLRLAGAASVLAVEAEAGEAWAAEIDANPNGFSVEIRGALRAGRAVPRSAYDDAKRARAAVCAQMRAVFERVDVLALPTVPITATPADVDRVSFAGRERSVEALQSLYTAPASLTGQPAVTVPCGSDADGMPVGLQLLGRPGDEAALLALADRIGITSDN